MVSDECFQELVVVERTAPELGMYRHLNCRGKPKTAAINPRLAKPSCNIKLAFNSNKLNTRNLPLKLNPFNPLKANPTPPQKMSHHCHDEHASHGGGSHSHGDHGDHDHDHSDDITPALQHSLYQQIHFDEVEAFNEATAGSARAVVKKTWAERMTEEPEVVSDADEQLLVNVP